MTSDRTILAGLAMQSLILSYDSRKDPPETMPGEVVAKMAIWHADALLAELERTKPPPCEHKNKRAMAEVCPKLARALKVAVEALTQAGCQLHPGCREAVAKIEQIVSDNET